MPPIDPSIALGFKMPQIQDPVAATARAQEVGVNALKMGELQRGIQEEQEIRNYLRDKNLFAPETRSGLSQFGKTGLAYGKLISEQEKTGLETKKLGNEITKQQLEQSRERVSNLAFNPSNENIIAHLQDSIKREEIDNAQAQAQLNKFINMPLDQRKQEFLQMGASVNERLKQTLTPAIREFEFGKTNPEFVNYQLAQKRAGATQVNMGGQPEFIKQLGKDLGSEFTKEFTATSNSAQSAAENLPKLYDTLNLINSSDAITGIGSEVLKNVERVKTQFLADKKAGKKVSDTEVLDAMLGSDVFPMIQSLGVGAKGMDTPAEREFLRGVMTGTTALDKDTLRRMTEIRVNLAKRAIEKYNANVNSGRYKPVETAQGAQLPRIDIPEFKGGAAPMFAVNPQTGERRQSTDGGKTWAPVGAK